MYKLSMWPPLLYISTGIHLSTYLWAQPPYHLDLLLVFEAFYLNLVVAVSKCETNLGTKGARVFLTQDSKVQSIYR